VTPKMVHRHDGLPHEGPYSRPIRTQWGSSTNPEVNERLARWCSQLLGEGGPIGPFSTMGVFEGNVPIGVIVFHDYRPAYGRIEISGASTSPRWFPRRVILEVCQYIFDQLKCQVFVMRVTESNTHMVDIANRYGFSGHLIPDMRGRGEGEWVFLAKREDWALSRFRKVAMS